MQWLSYFAFQKSPDFFIRTNTANLWHALFYFLQHVWLIVSVIII